jgi:hypothetical protein
MSPFAVPFGLFENQLSIFDLHFAENRQWVPAHLSFVLAIRAGLITNSVAFGSILDHSRE